MEGGGWLWLIIDVVGVLALAASLIYGTIMWRHRRKDRATQQKRNEAVHEIYRHGEQ
jgi:hypothetical protein